MNTYHVSGTFIGSENTVVILMKITPALTEPAVYGQGIQNSIGNIQDIQNRKLQYNPTCSICQQQNSRGIVRLVFFLVFPLQSCLEMLSVKMCLSF